MTHGPMPKDPKLRQRTNKASTNAILSADGSYRRVPPLPKRPHDWEPLTVAWWRDIWRSPMANEFIKADIHGLYRLAEVVNRFWEKPSIALAGEIRQQQPAYGLTPIDRRRLQWEVQKVDELTKRRETRKRREPTEDPRNIFKLMEGGMK